jgi:hypothetical protein
MSLPQELHPRLRAAVAAGSFEEAHRLVEDSGAALGQSLADSSLEGLPAERLREVQDLLEWARRSTCAARAHLAADLASLRGSHRYRRAEARPGSLRLDA